MISRRISRSWCSLRLPSASRPNQGRNAQDVPASAAGKRPDGDGSVPTSGVLPLRLRKSKGDSRRLAPFAKAMVRTYGLTHIGLAVGDAERSLRFYRRLIRRQGDVSGRNERPGRDPRIPRRDRVREERLEGGEAGGSVTSVFARAPQAIPIRRFAQRSVRALGYCVKGNSSRGSRTFSSTTRTVTKWRSRTNETRELRRGPSIVSCATAESIEKGTTPLSGLSFAASPIAHVVSASKAWATEADGGSGRRRAAVSS